MRYSSLKKTAFVIALGSAITILGGCSCDPKTKIVVVEPEAVIASNVYVRTPASAGMPLEYGGAALRDESYAYTLNDCEFCPKDESELAGGEETVKTQTVKTVEATTQSGAKAKATGSESTIDKATKVVKKKVRKVTKNVKRIAGQTADKVKKTTGQVEKKVRRKVEKVAPAAVVDPSTIDCTLYKKYCEPKPEDVKDAPASEEKPAIDRRDQHSVLLYQE